MAGVSAFFLSGKIKKTEYFKSKIEKGENFHEEIKSFRCVLLCVARLSCNIFRRIKMILV